MASKTPTPAWPCGPHPTPCSPAYAHAYAQAYASGRVEGEALRLKHQHEYEQLLFSGRRTRPLPQESADD